MIEEAHQVVHLIEGEAAGRADHRQARIGHRLEQRPVRRRAARHLEEVEAHPADEIDGGLVERRAHGEQFLGAHGVEQGLEIGRLELGREETLDVFIVAPLAVGGVDEAVELAELEFHGGSYAVLARHGGGGADHRLAVIDAALVVVGEVEDDQALEIEFVFNKHDH